ncbi:asparagine synthase (glutamine-hydrolyzing) [Candidatus Symbiobacter mobilis]|uniref:asparagine synthase (glutamine-hydrolyzing) n=1 Tax=Candidatus Symbiobacter mobilis CR TaxID=946483 RepID=U5N518_9BURK|nr:asparagine synthase (glutamine-hydrolyzing) [Candidatus Symbiobacter mobilis]AGX86616.1 asparagine synthase [Candidatus Symbiobacter mobilis CR]
MCGLVGISFSPPFTLQEDNLRAALAALQHRGPDDAGVFMDAERGIGLAHARLSILDLSPLGHQPMLSEDGRVALVFNGEIYNFRELRAELEAVGHVFCGHSDTEVLLHLYLAWRAHGGDLAKTLRRLNGIFAFALWDAERGALLLARDALGVKPLYYCADAGHFAFASEIKALLPLIGRLGPLDATALHRYLSFLWCPGEGTPASNVKKLGPGEWIWVRNGVIEERVVWYRLPAFRHAPSAMDELAAVSGTVQHLRAAVHRQLVADVPVGAFLSGGLDSSSVVVFARERNPNIRCFTIESAGGTEAGTADDLPYARRVAEHLGVLLEVVRVDAARMAEDLAGMVAQLDEPLADPAPLNVLYISRLARECGMKVLLSGAGGDDLFTGYRRHRAVLAERYWHWLPRPVRQGLAGLAGTLDQRWAWGRRLRKAFDCAALDGDARLVNYFAWSRRDDLMALYTPEFRAAVGEAEAGAPMLDFLAGLPSDLVPLERMLALEQRFFLADHNLIYTDKMSMAAGVEVRVPFLDLELVEFAQRIPIRFKQRGSEGKWVLKKAMEPYLPKDAIYRPKSGFGAPLRRWMRFELRELLGDVLGEASLRRRGLFDPIAVQKLIAANDAGRVDASYTLLSLLCVELWCRRFMDEAGEHSPVFGGSLA